ncbi:MAG: hypothetical protein HXS53_06090 [Theionarchaea archaeon]|nr:hypothetical protein [Theionarchaea archaeon]
MKLTALLFLALLSLSLSGDWTRNARIADMEFWPDFTYEEMIEGIDLAHDQGLSVCLVWLTSENIDIPSEDLSALKTAVSYAHSTYPDMKIIVYTAPLEIISFDVDKNRDSICDSGAASIYSDHPEWLQVGMDGQKAVFYGDFEFWVGKSDEDVWCCPNDPEYREKIKESFQSLAETGIDGIWIDVVQFLCTYGTWEGNWACHCEDCQRKFHDDTGLQIPRTVTWDETWNQWILWRQHVVEDFIWELSQTVKAVNEDIRIIVEHWHGFDAGSTENAWSPVGLQGVTDVLAHEYVSASESQDTYTPINYLRDVATYLLYRGIDKDHASWILSYSQEEDGQKMLAASILTAGCNYYDTIYPDMADSVSLPQRREIFRWLEGVDEYYYATQPLSYAVLYYSKSTIDFYDCPLGENQFYREFLGVSMMLLSLHIPYRVVTDLESLDQVDTLILPHVVCLGAGEIESLEHFLSMGGTIICTGKTGYCDAWGRTVTIPFTERGSSYTSFFATPELIGNAYYQDVNPYFWPDEMMEQGTGNAVKMRFSELMGRASVPFIDCDCSEGIVILPFIMPDDSSLLIYRVLNLQGISSGNAEPDPRSISIVNDRVVLRAWQIPFLSPLESIDPDGDTLTCPVEDHCLIMVELEPVSIFTNEFDYPAAWVLAQYLRSRGIPVRFIKSPEESTSTLIIFGGHAARNTGEFVSGLLSDQQKEELERPGEGDVFFFPGEIDIIIIAGADRECTALVTENAKKTIWTLI